MAESRLLTPCLAAAGLLLVAGLRTATAGDAAALPAPCPPESPAEPDRSRPGEVRPPFVPSPCNPLALGPPVGQPPQATGVPDRWRLVALLGYRDDLRDPYHGNNWLKADRPVFGKDWFVNLTAIADTVVEPRRFAVPVGSVVTGGAGQLDQVGDGRQLVLSQTFAFEAVLYEGDTVFKPPEWELRIEPVVNVNWVDAEERGLLQAPADSSRTRFDAALGLQALFVDRHLRNVSDRYDFDSLRVGIQPFTADFRGFLFEDSPFGVRLSGNRDDNRWQYNLAWFRRMEKDTNSGLNAVSGMALRNDDVFVANLYRQDLPAPGFTSQLVLLYNRNREGNENFYDANGFLQRPAPLGLEQGRDYDITYLGYNGDGHFGAWNLSVSLYGALGSESRGTFVDHGDSVRAFFGAGEFSRDFDWIRARASLLYASGDANPYDHKATGFDAVFENPLFAGADTSFWIRQPVPLIGGGRVSLSGRNGVLNDLRTSKDFGQSNFTNPGTILAGVGADFDLTPGLRVSANANDLWFADTASVEAARNQGGIGQHIGVDLSAAVTWRPLAIQNIVLRLSAAALAPGEGYRQLFGGQWSYSILGNIVLTY